MHFVRTVLKTVAKHKLCITSLQISAVLLLIKVSNIAQSSLRTGHTAAGKRVVSKILTIICQNAHSCREIYIHI